MKPEMEPTATTLLTEGGLSRRHFLLLALGFAAPIVAGAPGSDDLLGLFAGEASPGSSAKRLAALTAHRESAGIVGRAYLRFRPQEASAPWLVDTLVSSLPDPVGSAMATGRTLEGDQLRGAILGRIERDFEELQTVVVEGWVLSQTEARLCGLVSLVPAKD